MLIKIEKIIFSLYVWIIRKDKKMSLPYIELMEKLRDNIGVHYNELESNQIIIQMNQLKRRLK